MTDTDLKKLKDLPAPTPRASARNAAIETALSEFDNAQADASENRQSQQNINQSNRAPQGIAVSDRPKNASSKTERKPPMRFSSRYAIAASITAVAIAVPTALYINRDESKPQLTGLFDLDRSRQSGTRLPGLVGEQVAGAKPEKRKDDEFEVAGRSPTVSVPEPKLRGKLGKVAEEFRAEVDLSDGLGAVSDGAGRGNEQNVDPTTIVNGLTRANVKNRPVALAAKQAYASRPAPGLGVVATSSSADRVTRDPRQYRDKFEEVTSNPIHQVATDPVSTFSIDVDTASYSFVRRALLGGRLPPKNSVRVEELINYFSYGYDTPDTANVPFKTDVTVVPAPWNKQNKLVHISVQGYELKATERPNANLVFLIDVSGSMSSQDKLPLVKNALRMLVEELKPDDTIGIVTYASGTGVALEPTKLSAKSKILGVIDGLGAGGSTAGAQGIADAYRLAQANFDPEGVNRIILATDGDFNVGVTDGMELKGYIERKRKAGVFLSILGVGQGNYNDALMQTLAQNGNGTASYIDTLNEARKVLVDEASSTLFTIAKDVKIQVEFNPTRVRSYRLIGYETRALKREDFNNDRVDAGDVGSGHSVTAIYEVTPVGAPALVDDLRYEESKPAAVQLNEQDTELGFLKLRYKLPNETASKLLSQPISNTQQKHSISAVSNDVRFAIAVAGFGQMLRGEPHLSDFTFDDVANLAKASKGDDQFGYRAEFINLVRLAKSARP